MLVLGVGGLLEFASVGTSSGVVVCDRWDFCRWNGRRSRSLVRREGGMVEGDEVSDVPSRRLCVLDEAGIDAEVVTISSLGSGLRNWPGCTKSNMILSG